jgi:hypothetical protein
VFDDDDHQGTVLFDDQVSLYEPEVLDGYLTAQVLLPRGDEYKLRTVIKRSVDANAQPRGLQITIQSLTRVSIYSSLTMVRY